MATSGTPLFGVGLVTMTVGASTSKTTMLLSELVSSVSSRTKKSSLLLPDDDSELELDRDSSSTNLRVAASFEARLWVTLVGADTDTAGGIVGARLGSSLGFGEGFAAACFVLEDRAEGELAEVDALGAVVLVLGAVVLALGAVFFGGAAPFVAFLFAGAAVFFFGSAAAAFLVLLVTLLVGGAALASGGNASRASRLSSNHLIAASTACLSWSILVWEGGV